MIEAQSAVNCLKLILFTCQPPSTVMVVVLVGVQGSMILLYD